MTGALTHRGPDSDGFFVSEHVALGHRRLRIIDLVTGDQPMSSQSERYIIAFNGEIYNFVELGQRLRASGVEFHTQSDTEVLLELLALRGWEAIGECLGMFAIALWDRLERRLILIRDRLGVKPLWFTIDRDGSILFGSEIKALLISGAVERRLDREGLVDYFLYRQAGRTHSLFDGIQQVPPGSALIWRDGQVRIERYWNLSLTRGDAKLTDREAVSMVRSEVEAAVRRRMISDVPIGAYLSGGLDSSIVVAVMAAQSGAPVKTFSIGFPDEGYSEFPFAREVARRYDTNHHEIELNLSGYQDLWRDMIRFRDSPLSVPNEVALYRMSQELKKSITVVLSGEGADELFAGYGRIFRSADDFARMRWMVTSAGLFSAAVLDEMRRPLLNRYGRLDFTSAMEFFLHRYRWFKAEDVAGLLSRSAPLRGTVTPELEAAMGASAALDDATRFLYLFQLWHLHGLLMRLDATTMACAVEARTPFVDHTLIEKVFALPFTQKCRFLTPAHECAAAFESADTVSERLDTTKWVLREAFRGDLPEAILNRRKVGFPVPLGPWLENGLATFARDVITDRAVRELEVFDEAAVLAFIAKAQSPDESLKVWMLCNVGLFIQEYFGADAGFAGLE